MKFGYQKLQLNKEKEEQEEQEKVIYNVLFTSILKELLLICFIIGDCFRMYTQRRFSDFEKHEIPEIFRVPLQQLCLQIRLLQNGINKSKKISSNDHLESFLSRSIQPPQKSAIQSAVSSLIEFGALDKSENLTPVSIIILFIID